jgi:hypothetical protein
MHFKPENVLKVKRNLSCRNSLSNGGQENYRVMKD